MGRVRAFTGKKFRRQRLDDPPLRRIGILRLIDQHMIKAPIKLVADPVGHMGLAQKIGGMGDLVVKIDQPLARLGFVPRQCIGPAKA